MIDLLFAGLVAVAMPVRAWRRHRRQAGAAPTARYVAETLTLTGVLAALLWRRQVPLTSIGLQPGSFARFLLDLAVCLIVVVGLDVISVWRMTRQVREAAADPVARVALLVEPDRKVADALAVRRALPRYLVVVAVGAVWEELCFRASVFLIVPPTPAGVLLGIAGGSIVFGAQHLRNGPGAMAYSTFFGVMFSLLYLATGDLIAVILAHAAGNILAVVQWAPRIERARQAALRQSPMSFG